MPVPSSDFKKAIQRLSDKEKEAFILKAVRRDAELYDLLSFELLEEVTYEQVYGQSADEIRELLLGSTGRYRGKSLTKGLRKAVKEIARFKRITKEPKGEVDLHLHLLQLIFEHFTEHFEGYYKAFYTATARLTVRTRQLILKNLHEDYHLEYQGPLDGFLSKLRDHNKSRGLSFELPQGLKE
ncbi:hypothetical protein BH24BAC1_BH24BAC1_11990 [soil metagenome]